MPSTKKRKSKGDQQDGKTIPSKGLSACKSILEFYFSDSNLNKDRFLKQKIAESPEGWVALGVLSTFNKVGENPIPPRISLTHLVCGISVSYLRIEFVHAIYNLGFIVNFLSLAGSFAQQRMETSTSCAKQPKRAKSSMSVAMEKK